MSQKGALATRAKRKRTAASDGDSVVPHAKKQQLDGLKSVVFHGIHRLCTEVAERLFASVGVEILPDPSNARLHLVCATKGHGTRTATISGTDVVDPPWTPYLTGPGWPISGSLILASGADAAEVGDMSMVAVPALFLGGVKPLDNMRLPEALEELRLACRTADDALPFLEAAALTGLRKLSIEITSYDQRDKNPSRLGAFLRHITSLRTLFLAGQGCGIDARLEIPPGLELVHANVGWDLRCHGQAPKTISVQRDTELEGLNWADVESLILHPGDVFPGRYAGAINVTTLQVGRLCGSLLLLDRLQTVYLTGPSGPSFVELKICVLSYRRLRYHSYNVFTGVEDAIGLDLSFIDREALFGTVDKALFPHSDTDSLLATYAPGNRMNMNLVVCLARMVRRPRLSLRELCMQQAVASHMSQRAVGAHRLPLHVREEIVQRVEDARNM